MRVARHSWKGLLRWQIDKKEDIERREALFLIFRGESQLIKDYLRAAAAAVAKLLHVAAAAPLFFCLFS